MLDQGPLLAAKVAGIRRHPHASRSSLKGRIRWFTRGETMPGISTVVLHADRDVHPTRAVAPPIYQTATFWAEDAEQFARAAVQVLTGHDLGPDLPAGSAPGLAGPAWCTRTWWAGGGPPPGPCRLMCRWWQVSTTRCAGPGAHTPQAGPRPGASACSSRMGRPAAHRPLVGLDNGRLREGRSALEGLPAEPLPALPSPRLTFTGRFPRRQGTQGARRGARPACRAAAGLPGR